MQIQDDSEFEAESTHDSEDEVSHYNIILFACMHASTMHMRILYACQMQQHCNVTESFENLSSQIFYYGNNYRL